MNFLGILGLPLGYVMEWLCKIIPNYGLALIVFTVLIKIVTFPLGIKQQKSMAKMQAYQPMMTEIQKKWANDKNRQNQEMMKFQEETGMSMSFGCMPMLVNMLVIFGLIQIIYYPLQYIFHIGTDLITQGLSLAGMSELSINLQQSHLLAAVNQDPAKFSSLFGDVTDSIAKLNLNFLGLDLTIIPSFDNLVSLILPVLTVVTMIAMQIITTKMTGQQVQGSMKYMPWVMSLFFAWFCFTVPVGFSLYYAVSNILGLVQSIILKKMYDPEEIKKQVMAEIEEKRAAKKRKKQIAIKAEDGKVITKDVSEAELARIRLAKAREIDAQRYED